MDTSYIKALSTLELINELAKREGVDVLKIPPHGEKRIFNKGEGNPQIVVGPAIVVLFAE